MFLLCNKVGQTCRCLHFLALAARWLVSQNVERPDHSARSKQACMHATKDSHCARTGQENPHIQCKCHARHIALSSRRRCSRVSFPPLAASRLWSTLFVLCMGARENAGVGFSRRLSRASPARENNTPPTYKRFSPPTSNAIAVCLRALSGRVARVQRVPKTHPHTLAHTHIKKTDRQVQTHTHTHTQYTSSEPRDRYWKSGTRDSPTMDLLLLG